MKFGWSPTTALAAAMIASTAVVVAEAPAQALTLAGDVGIAGRATLPNFPAVDQTFNISFGNTFFTFKEGDFTNITGTPTVNPLTLTVTKKTGNNFVFSTPEVSPFINFGQQTIRGTTKTLLFVLNANTNLTGDTNGTVNFENDIIGRFIFGSETIATGRIDVSRNKGAKIENGSYFINLAAEPIPTPALLPGLVGMGVAALRKHKSESGEEAEA